MEVKCMSIDKQDAHIQEHRNDSCEMTVLNFLDRELLATARSSANQHSPLEDLDTLISDLLEESIIECQTNAAGLPTGAPSDCRIEQERNRPIEAPPSRLSEPSPKTALKLSHPLQDTIAAGIEATPLLTTQRTTKREASLPLPGTDTSRSANPPTDTATASPRMANNSMAKQDEAVVKKPMAGKIPITDTAVLFAPTTQKKGRGMQMLIMGGIFLILLAALGCAYLFGNDENANEPDKSSRNSAEPNGRDLLKDASTAMNWRYAPAPIAGKPVSAGIAVMIPFNG
jgi:hypothetical protein